MITIEATINGEALTIHARHPSEMVLSDWAALMTPDGEESEAIARYLGLTLDQYRAIPMWAMAQIEEAYLEAYTTIAQEVTAQPLTPTYTYKGKEYTVPQDIDKDTTIGQWADLQRDLALMESPAQAAPAILARLLVPVGETYQGIAPEEFNDFPLLDGMRYVSFFLTSNKRLQSAIDHIAIRYLKSLRDLTEQAAKSMASGGQDGTSSSALPIATVGFEVYSETARTGQ